MGLVCFRLKDDPTNKLNKKLLETINESGKLHMVPALVHDKYVIRFCVVAEHATEDDIGKTKIKLWTKNFLTLEIVEKYFKTDENIFNINKIRFYK